MRKFFHILVIVLGLLSLCFTHVGHDQDNLLNSRLQDTIVNISSDTVGIEKVTVQGKMLTPEEKLKQRQEEYRIIYLHGDNKNIVEGFLIFPPVLIVNINKIYNHFSVSGKQARRFQQLLIDEFEQDKIAEVWHPLTLELTKLEGQQLEDFRQYYRPDYDWLMQAEDWEKMDYVFKKLKHYQDSANYVREFLRLP